MFTRCRCVCTRVRASAPIALYLTRRATQVVWSSGYGTHTDADESEKHAKTSSRGAARCHLVKKFINIYNTGSSVK
ncbi:unnamed protein product [Trichogramma brassicae]|uniref:Uncharacterized protein n=1 Tax=Trichogramma brassicae TaxID=86971 RepID=A0A6H5IJX2_9HYME|nr:unnamed protein product [Trichogramma brassicae]